MTPEELTAKAQALTQAVHAEAEAILADPVRLVEVPHSTYPPGGLEWGDRRVDVLEHVAQRRCEDWDWRVVEQLAGPPLLLLERYNPSSNRPTPMVYIEMPL